MENLHHILLIDDEKEYCSRLKSEAISYNLMVNFFHNLEEGMKGLESNRQYNYVILDDRCILNPEDHPNNAKSNFVIKAFDEINRIEKKHDRTIPFCVNAYNVEEFKELFAGTTKVFKKYKGHKEMFDHIRQTLNQLEEVRITEKYKSTFKFIHNHWGNNEVNYMMDIIKKIERKDSASIIKNLSMIRRMEENLFSLVCRQQVGENLENFYYNHKKGIKAMVDWLEKKEHLPGYLKHTAYQIYHISSEYASHVPRKNDYFPGNFTSKSVFYGLMALIKWANQYIEDS
jgi:hypothetical protein